MSDHLNLRLLERRKLKRRSHPDVPSHDPDRRLDNRRSMQKDDALVLGRFSLFKGFSIEQLGNVAHVMRLGKYKQDEIIITEGEVGGEMYILLEGQIAINKKLTLSTVHGADRKEKSLVHLKDTMNVFFGEMSMFGEDERSATVYALSDVSLGIITSKAVLSLAEKDPLLGFKLYNNIGRRLADNLRVANRDILKLTTAFCLALESK